jgi:energy-coupling factor transport system permease protein
MSARGYGIGKRSSFTYFRWHTGDLILLLTSLLLSAAVIAGIASGVLEWQFYPVCESAKRTLPYAAILAAYALLAALPLIHEGKETLTWKRLRSGI